MGDPKGDAFVVRGLGDPSSASGKSLLLCA